jgi:SAM-dependent methyltransferase
MTKYRKAFYESLESQGLTSAREVLPFLFDWFKPASVVDVGCGTGEWLSVCRELGVQDVLGMDFHAGEMLKIPKTSFLQQDLSAPFTLPRTYDLAMSLEVGEHLPPESAAGFVGSITSLASVVLFSAAIPAQGGTGHVNEQWPDYWAALFEQFGFVPVDCVRPLFWENEKVTCYYAQNAVLYVKRGLEIKDLPSFNLKRFVHPGLFGDQATELRQLRPLFTARGLVKRLPGALWNSVAERWRNAVNR